jgi:hypothetical protein
MKSNASQIVDEMVSTAIRYEIMAESHAVNAEKAREHLASHDAVIARYTAEVAAKESKAAQDYTERAKELRMFAEMVRELGS